MPNLNFAGALNKSKHYHNIAISKSQKSEVGNQKSDIGLKFEVPKVPKMTAKLSSLKAKNLFFVG